MSLELFELERTTIWSFPNRGNWAGHNGGYRGNWAPEIPRNLILRYSNPGDTVLDCFVGSGTTALEAKLLNRRFIGVDINQAALDLTDKLVRSESEDSGLQLFLGDARKLEGIADESIDLICAHPPYGNIIKYSHGIEGDLSLVSLRNFSEEMGKVARECLRVLKPGRCCAILMGDTRKNKRVVPLGFQVFEKFLSVGFLSKEIVIKRQHNCHSTPYWQNRKIDFLLLEHEYLFVFEK